MGWPMRPTPMNPIVSFVTPTSWCWHSLRLDVMMVEAGRPLWLEGTHMEFGILFTSHANEDVEPYPRRTVHGRVTREIVRADQLGFDYAWLAEHHFSDEYGIMPDVFVYAGYLAALTQRIKIGTAVVTLPLANPVRVAENTA